MALAGATTAMPMAWMMVIVVLATGLVFFVMARQPREAAI